MFVGRVHDLDFIATLDWCQAIIQSDSMQLVAVTSDHRMQTLLEVAFQTSKYVQVDYKSGDPNVLTQIKLNRETPPGG
jgi:hypothetical protein